MPKAKSSPQTRPTTIFTKYKKKYHIDNFSKENQYLFALVLLKHKVYGKPDEDHYINTETGKRFSAFELISNGEFEKAIKICSYEWASLPPSRYGQPNKTISEALEYYSVYFQKEIIGQSSLKISNDRIVELLND